MSGITKADLERYASKPEADTLTRDLASHALALTAMLTAAEQEAADLARRLAVVEGAAFAFEHAVGDARLSGAARYRRGLLVDTLTGAEKRAATPAPRAEQDSPGPGDAGNMPDGRLSGALTDRSATSVISPAPRVIASDEFAKKGRAMFVEAGFKDVASACGDAPADDGGPRECNWVGCHRSFGHDGAHERWALGPIASPAPAPDAGEAAPANVVAAVDAALAEVRRQGGPDYLLTEARSIGIDEGSRSLLATPNATDEERAHEFIGGFYGQHMDLQTTWTAEKRLTTLLAKHRTERDAAHRAEVAEAEAARAALDAQHQVTLRALQDQIDSLETSMSQAAREAAEWHSRYTQAVKDAVAAEGRAYERALRECQAIVDANEPTASTIGKCLNRLRALGAK